MLHPPQLFILIPGTRPGVESVPNKGLLNEWLEAWMAASYLAILEDYVKNGTFSKCTQRLTRSLHSRTSSITLTQ